MGNIYLDNNATTPLDPRVLEAIVAELKMGPSNPSSIHSFGRAAKSRLENAREKIADFLHVFPNELIFTSSGTEAVNMALHGLKNTGRIISTNIEHACIDGTLKQLANPVTYLPIGPEGHIQIADLEKAIDSDVSLIVLSAVNSETGVKNPLNAIAALAEKEKIPLFIDGVALLGKELFTIPPGVTAMAFSGHKIHGPKGAGLLYLKKGTRLSPLLFGGGQEASRRPGTENLPGIIGFAKAIELLSEELPSATEHMETLRNQLEEALSFATPNGTGPRICNTSNLYFPNTDGEGLLIQLDLQNIAASMGSACSSASLEPSRVLLEMGLSRLEALSSLRFSFSRFTTEKEGKQAIENLRDFL